MCATATASSWHSARDRHRSSRRKAEVVNVRAASWIDEVHQGALEKIKVFDAICTNIACRMRRSPSS